ncbi:MAG TPA: aminoacyl-tRNA hydrolase [Phaeodactylibacter sp.]|nr:aminoacyl-tRNA hydrolase [Phaeodactylibacter sp.]
MLKWLRNLFFSKKEVVPISEPAVEKYLIVGLGNIGEEYEETRHNVGFKVIDLLAEKHGLEFGMRGDSFWTVLKMDTAHFFLIKPTTYMNLSGKAVRYWLKREKIPIHNLLVVVDDLNIPLGKLRLRPKGSDGGHNGLKHINLVLQGNQYPRLRFGIGGDFPKGQQVDFVLGEWTEEERQKLPNLLERAAEMVYCFGTETIERCMSKYNN